MYNLKYIIDVIGLYSYIILFCISSIILLLNHRYNTFIIYFIGYYFTFFIVCILKILIKSPRPKNMIPFLEEEKILLNNSIEQYGMPSGHATAAFYTMSFMWFMAKKIATIYFFYIGGFISCCALFQRWYYKRHSIIQLLFGAFLGIFMGWVIFYFGRIIHSPYILTFLEKNI